MHRTEVTSVRPGGRRTVLDDLRAAQKPASAGSPAYSRFVNRRIGRYLAALAVLLRATPDQVSAVSAVLTAGGLALVALGPADPGTAVAATALLVLGYALDSADGQLARLTGRCRPAGEWLDHTVDAFKVGAVHGCVLVGWLRAGERSGPVLLAPMLFAVLACGLFFTTWLTERLRREYGHGVARAATGRAGTVRSVLLLPTDFGALILVFGLWGLPQAFRVAYLGLLVATLAFAVLALPRWFREVAGFGAGR